MHTANMIPARGTVEFIMWDYSDTPDYPNEITIDGPREWRRPVVGLIGSHPLRDKYDNNVRSRYLGYYPVVVDEIGSLYDVYDYLECVMGESHWDCASHFYRPHIDGPVSDAPRVRVQPKPGTLQHATTTGGR
jgi:hypothetical protein